MGLSCMDEFIYMDFFKKGKEKLFNQRCCFMKLQC